MMNQENNTNETFLSDWMAGTISDSQLRELVSENDYNAYLQLRASLQDSQVSEPDMEMNYAAIRAKIAEGKKKQSRIIPLFRYAAVAALLVLFVGLYQLFMFTNQTETDYGKTALVELKDQSKVTLNAKSEVAFPALFNYNRTLRLQGEAYFEVAKGSTFTVETDLGKVQVLGTRFNVISRPGFFEVTCFEGKVKVCHKQEEITLLKGDAVRFSGNQKEIWKETPQYQPLWLNGESSFRNVPLHFVISQLQNQYHYQVEYPERLAAVKFSGSFSNKNLDIALKSICLPLNLTYSKTTGKIIISE